MGWVYTLWKVLYAIALWYVVIDCLEKLASFCPAIFLPPTTTTPATTYQYQSQTLVYKTHGATLHLWPTSWRLTHHTWSLTIQASLFTLFQGLCFFWQLTGNTKRWGSQAQVGYYNTCGSTRRTSYRFHIRPDSEVGELLFHPPLLHVVRNIVQIPPLHYQPIFLVLCSAFFRGKINISHPDFSWA